MSSVEVDALSTTGSAAAVAEGGHDRTTAASPTSTSGCGGPPSRCRHRRGRSPAVGVAPGLGRGIPRLECRRLLQRRVRNRSAQRQSLRRARSGAVGAARRQLMESPRKTVRPRGRTVSTPASPSGPAAPAGTTDCTTPSPPPPAEKRYASTTSAWTGLWPWPPAAPPPPSSPPPGSGPAPPRRHDLRCAHPRRHRHQTIAGAEHRAAMLDQRRRTLRTTRSPVQPRRGGTPNRPERTVRASLHWTNHTSGPAWTDTVDSPLTRVDR